MAQRAHASVSSSSAPRLHPRTSIGGTTASRQSLSGSQAQSLALQQQQQQLQYQQQFAAAGRLSFSSHHVIPLEPEPTGRTSFLGRASITSQQLRSKQRLSTGAGLGDAGLADGFQPLTAHTQLAAQPTTGRKSEVRGYSELKRSEEKLRAELEQLRNSVRAPQSHEAVTSQTPFASGATSVAPPSATEVATMREHLAELEAALADSEARRESADAALRDSNDRVTQLEAEWRRRLEEREREFEARLAQHDASTKQQLVELMEQLDRSQRTVTRLQRALEDANINPVSLKPLTSDEQENAREREFECFKEGIVLARKELDEKRNLLADCMQRVTNVQAF